MVHNVIMYINLVVYLSNYPKQSQYASTYSESYTKNKT
jgi:hypothetical protein